MKSPPNLQLRLCMFLNYCAYSLQLSSVGIAVLQVQRNFGLSVATASTLAVYKGFGILLGAVGLGSFVKRIGHRRAMLIGLAGSALVLALVPLMVSFTMIKVVFFVTGLGYGLVKVAMYSTIGLISPTRQAHANLLGLVEGFYKVGSLLTFLVFAAFTDDLNPASTSWANGYVVLAALMLVAFGLLLATKLDESELREDGSKPALVPFIEMARLAATPLAITLATLVLATVGTEFGFMNFLPSFNSKVMNLTPALGIKLAGLFSLWSVVGRFAAALVVRRVEWSRVLGLCVAGTAALLVVGLLLKGNPPEGTIANWRDVPLTVHLLALAGIFVAPIFPLIHTAALTSLPVAQHSTLASISVLCSSMAGAFGTPLVGLVFQYYGGVTALYSLLVPIVVILAGILLLRRITEARMQTT